MSTVAIIASRDTKGAEVDYVADRLKALDTDVITLDISTSSGHTSTGEISREEIVAAAGFDWAELDGRPRDVLLEAVSIGAAEKLGQLYGQGRIQAAIGLGGLQNTTVAAHAMQALPIGVPKLIVSTVACGTRTFDMIVGAKDVTVMPAVTDLAGLNFISERVLANAAGALDGMVRSGGRAVDRPLHGAVGTTLIGATNDGVVQAAAELASAGVPVVPFHATGVGGQVLEDLVRDGVLTAVMDLTLHEIVYEYFGGGFGSGTTNRLNAGAKAGIPMVVAPGGIDFICQWRERLFDDADERKMIWHNSDLAHVRLREHEVREISQLIVKRLNAATGPVTVLLPTKGLRTLAGPGEPLADPVIDSAIVEEFRRGLRPDIRIRVVEANLVDPEFAHVAAEEMLRTAPVGQEAMT